MGRFRQEWQLEVEMWLRKRFKNRDNSNKEIVMPILLILFLFFPILSYATDLPSSIHKAEKLYQLGDYEESIELFEECFQDSRNPACILQPLNLIERAYSSLPKLSKGSLTRFTPQKTNISMMEYLTKEATELFKSPFNLIGITTGAPSVDLLDIDKYTRLYHFIAGENNPGSPIRISSPEDMAKITTSIPFFKAWTKKISDMARTCYSKDDLEICFDYMKKVNSLRKDLDKYYRNFFSYEIASPILAKTQQLIFIADDKKYFGVDENIMRDAAKALGTINDDMIMYLNQDVRNQFADVVREFKDKAGKEFTEELKAIQTLQDKFVNNRYSEQIF